MDRLQVRPSITEVLKDRLSLVAPPFWTVRQYVPVESKVHIAEPVGPDGVQRCERCTRQLGGTPSMVPPEMSVAEFQATEWETFPPGAMVLEEASDTTTPVSHTVEMREIDGAQVAAGDYLMCGEWRSERDMDREMGD